MDVWSGACLDLGLGISMNGGLGQGDAKVLDLEMEDWVYWYILTKWIGFRESELCFHN